MGAFLLHLANALADCGVTTDVIAPHAAALASDESIGAARVHRFRYAPERWERLAYAGTMHEIVGRGLANKILFLLFNLGLLGKALGAVRTLKPQLIHAHWCLPDGLLGAIASLLTRTPLVITTHGTDVEMLRRTHWAVPLARFTFSRAAAITCGSTYLRDQLLALGVADARRVSVVPMPVGGEFQIADCRFQIEREGVLTVARLTKQKSVETLIEAVGILRDRGGDARLTIVGDGPERGALEARVDTLRLRDRVEFLGALAPRDLPPYYRRCRVFALPSIREGMGLVFAEALFGGAPVIAADSGGVTDIVKNGTTGLLVPERNPAALADAIAALLGDRALAERLAAAGLAWVRERYSSERVAAQFLEIYQHVALAL